MHWRKFVGLSVIVEAVRDLEGRSCWGRSNSRMVECLVGGSSCVYMSIENISALRNPEIWKWWGGLRKRFDGAWTKLHCQATIFLMAGIICSPNHRI